MTSSGSPTIGVLALQGDVREHVAAVERCGARSATVRRERELRGVDGLILPGGESTTIEKLLKRFELYGPLREAIAAGLPVYGSCAGMILLADRILDAAHDQDGLGGMDVTVRRNAFGRQVDSFEVDLEAPLLTGGDGRALRAVFIRAPWVESVGDRVTVLAAIPADSVSAAAGRIVAVRQDALLATSFHPEVAGEDRVHRTFLRMVDAAR